MHDLVCADMHPKYLGFGLRPFSERHGLSANFSQYPQPTIYLQAFPYYDH